MPCDYWASQGGADCRRLHLYLVSEMARIPSESGLFYALNCGRIRPSEAFKHIP
jgi:23S rRNA G2069 N7-methylase RlmK/C1962 C5-methylase RlmI